MIQDTFIQSTLSQKHFNWKTGKMQGVWWSSSDEMVVNIFTPVLSFTNWS